MEKSFYFSERSAYHVKQTDEAAHVVKEHPLNPAEAVAGVPIASGAQTILHGPGPWHLTSRSELTQIQLLIAIQRFSKRTGLMMICASVVSAILTCLPCNCVPPNICKQADTTKLKAVPYELTTRQPSPTQGPTSVFLQQPTYTDEAVPRTPPADLEPDLETTLTFIEASIADEQEQERELKDEAEQTLAVTIRLRDSAPPNLELILPRNPLPDFSLTSRSRLSYWGPSPFSPPDQPLPAIPAAAHCDELTRHSPIYTSYFAGEDSHRRILRHTGSNPRLNNDQCPSL